MLAAAVAVAVAVTSAVVTSKPVDVIVLAPSVTVPAMTDTVDVLVAAAGVVIKQLQAEESTFWASSLSCERLAACRFLKGPGVGGGVLKDKSINRLIES